MDEKFYTSAVHAPRSRIQSTDLVDASITWELPGSMIQFSLWAENLFDERYVAAVADTPGLGGFLSYQVPREYGISARLNF